MSSEERPRGPEPEPVPAEKPDIDEIIRRALEPLPRWSRELEEVPA